MFVQTSWCLDLMVIYNEPLELDMRMRSLVRR
jgi:hypothetical protein